MAVENAGINPVKMDAGTGGVVTVARVQGQRALVDPIEPPRRRGRLGAVDADDSVWLDERHVRLIAQPLQFAGRNVTRPAMEGVLIDPANLGALRRDVLGDFRAGIADAGLIN